MNAITTGNRLGRLVALLALLAGMREAPAQTCRNVPKLDCELRTKSAPSDQGAVLMVDGKPLGVTDIQNPPLRLAPGPHTMYVERTTQRGRPMEVDCPSGGRVEFQPALSPDELQGLLPWSSVLLLDEQLGTDLEQALRVELTRKLETVNLLTVPADRAVLAGLPGAAAVDCPELLCAQTALDCLGAQWALHIRPPTPDAPTQYKLRLRDHRVWQGFAETTVDLPGQDRELLVPGLVTAAYELLVKPAQTQQQAVTITSTPPGAEVRLNGHPAGRTPWSQHLYNGDYAVGLRRPGYLPMSRALSVITPPRDANQTLPDPNRVVASMELDPALLRRRALQKGLAWPSLVTGVLTLGAGVTLLVLHGQQFDCDPQDPTVCTHQLDSQAGGIVATATGGVLLGVTGLLFGLAAREPK